MAESGRWNPFQFVETLTFFGEVPFIGNFRWLQQMLDTSSNPQAPDQSEMQPPLAVLLLTEEGDGAAAVRSCVGKQNIPLRSPSASDTHPSPLERLVNVKALVWSGMPGDEECLAAQVDDLKALSTSEECLLFDFQTGEATVLRDVWGAVDDVVMGGTSASGISLLPGFARFSGQVSTANSGGFASVRSRNFEPPFNLANWQGIRLVLRGDGQRYKVILRNSHNWDSLAYATSIDTENDHWLGVDIPFSAFQPTFRARTQPTASPLNPAAVCSFQLMLSKFEYNGEENPHFRPGAFSLDVRSLGAYRAVSLPLVVAIATSAEQANLYHTQLAPSGIAHQVIDLSHGQSFAEQFLQAIGGN